jgi:hypothetical protein
MPIYIDRITSDVTVLAGELPLSPAQIDKLVQVILRRLDERQREAQQGREATALKSGAEPRMQFGD